MARGKVLSFDRVKGYGFVAPETGGEDVFIHVNDLYSDKDLLTAGSTVEFTLEEGERGPKAAAITVIEAAAWPAARSARSEGEGDGLADVLTATEFAHEFTEVLLTVEPELSSRQILDIRERLSRVCRDHGWLDS